MRGKQREAVIINESGRITPAHAGKTLRIIEIFKHFWDHPRACGENMNRYLLPKSAEGSPPRMRGKLEPFGISEQFERITPAHAGKTG